ncbi:MAG: NADH-quinone oxidoreductase subunit C [Verrucomicrobiota bacterium JB023]|nr:NADH-quinone oxidoreductase subunit C [Verrucomicrobiota bacterium JB023]
MKAELIKEDAETLKSRFKVLEVVEFRGETTLVVDFNDLEAVLKAAYERGYDFLIDISSIDHDQEEPRFEMVYELATLDDSKHLRIRSRVSEGVKVPTAISIWATADWHEREVYDMMGIEFEGHPDLRRILMWEGYPYFPLRKEFPLAGKVTELPDVASTGVAPMEGGPFVTSPGGDTITSEPRAKGES